MQKKPFRSFEFIAIASAQRTQLSHWYDLICAQAILIRDPCAAETLKAFATQKIRFRKLQQVNMTLSYLLLVATAILLSRIVSGKDISESKYLWIFSITFGYIFLLFYSKWVMKHYSKTLKQAEELLKELAA